MSQTERTVLGKRFFVHLAGKTNGAHVGFVKSLRGYDQIEVSRLEDSDYLLVFCPIASRVGTDISEALENMPGGKAAMLVVMHHTFNPNHIVAPSNRQVTNPNVLLTVDCLFYEGSLLQSTLNEIALNDIRKALGVPHSQGSSWTAYFSKMNSWALVGGGAAVVIAVVVLTIIIVEMSKK